MYINKVEPSRLHLVFIYGTRRRRYFRSTIKIKAVLFCIVLAYSYLWLSPKILPLGNKKKNEFSFCIPLAYSYLCQQETR